MMNNRLEEKYIRKRRRQARLVNQIYQMLRIFPVKKNKIVFTDFEGKGG